jgi:hypothetical protein
MSTDNRTKGVWKVSTHNDTDEIVIRDSAGYIIANLECDFNEAKTDVRKEDESIANAAYIVKAVNEREELIEALRPFVELAKEVKANGGMRKDPRTILYSYNKADITHGDLSKALELLAKAEQVNTQ